MRSASRRASSTRLTFPGPNSRSQARARACAIISPAFRTRSDTDSVGEAFGLFLGGGNRPAGGHDLRIAVDRQVRRLHEGGNRARRAANVQLLHQERESLLE